MYRKVWIVYVHEYNMEKQQMIGPYCRSKEMVKRGFNQTGAHGKRQRYFCKSCPKRFIPQDAFYRMW